MQIRNRSRLLGAIGAAALFVAPLDAHAEFPSLASSVELARARAIGVSDARGELGAAQAQAVGARVSSLGNPYTDVQVDRGIGDATTVQALTYSYFPIDIAGQRGRRVEEAAKLIDWRRVGVEDARATATGDVVAAYGEIVVGVARAAEAAAGEQTAREEARYFAGRLEAKDTTVYEKALADAEVARWVQTHAEATLRLTTARVRFAQLTGTITVELPPRPPDPAPPALRGRWDDARVAEVVARAPVLVRLAAERRFWEASGARYERERVPPVAIELIAGRGSLGEPRIGGGAVITFPITRRYQGEIARAEEGREHASNQLALYRTVIESGLRAARESLEIVRAALDELDRNGVPALERAVSASVDAFRAGKVDLARTLLARRDLATARARRLDLLEAGWRAYADLARLSGELP